MLNNKPGIDRSFQNEGDWESMPRQSRQFGFPEAAEPYSCIKKYNKGRFPAEVKAAIV